MAVLGSPQCLVEIGDVSDRFEIQVGFVAMCRCALDGGLLLGSSRWL